MRDGAPFRPHWGTGQTLNATSASAVASLNSNNKSVRVTNTGSTNVAYVRVFSSKDGASLAADTTQLLVLPNTTVIIGKSEDQDSLSYISASGTTLNIMTGEGGQ